MNLNGRQIDLKQIYLSSSGRIGRLHYFLYLLAVVVVAAIIGSVLVMLLKSIGMIIVQLAILYPFYNLAAKRLQDFDKPGNWALGLVALSVLSIVLGYVLPSLAGLVGLLQLIVALVILFMPGTPGDNTYGPQPA